MSATNAAKTNATPFPLDRKNASCNTAYAYFLESCATHGIKAAFTTSSDIVGAGLCTSYWSFKNKKWQKNNRPCSAPTIFDKFNPKNKKDSLLRDLLFSNSTIEPFNDPALLALFFDKQKTYDTLSEHAIPTVSLMGHTLENIIEACHTLTTTMNIHRGSKDFTNDIIMKDRYGAGGWHVYKFKPGQSTDMAAITSSNPQISFVLQPFAKFDKGYVSKHNAAATDIRLIYLGGKIIESYIRVAKTNDFRCNEHQGGALTYLNIKDIPQKIISKANKIITTLQNQHSLYSLDFIISNNGNPYLLEGNTGPGLDWNLTVKKEEVNAKKFIRAIVKELSLRCQLPPLTSPAVI